MAIKKTQYHIYQYRLSDVEEMDGTLMVHLSVEDAVQTSGTRMYYILNKKLEEKAYDS